MITFTQTATLVADTDAEFVTLKAEYARYAPGGADEGKLTYAADETLRRITLSRVVTNYGTGPI